MPGSNRFRTADIVLALALVVCVGASANAREIAITFDDAPRGDGRRFTGVERTEALIAALQAGGVPGALFFSTTRNIDAEGGARLLRYQDAGHYIGNHSHSHAAPEERGLQVYLDDIAVADRRLRTYDAFLPLFRYPFLNEGRDIAMRDGIRAGLASLGLSNGYVTVDTYDWYMEHLYQRALEQGRPVNEERLGEVYVALLIEAVNFYDAIARDALGRSPRHVLLLHENDLAALFVDDLARALKADGWTLIPAPRAYLDPIARVIPDTLFNGQGRVAAIAEAQGRPRRELVHEAEDEAWLEAHFEVQGVYGGAGAWYPFASDLVFSSNENGTSQVYLRKAGESAWHALTDAPGGANYPVWSPDGTRLAYQVRDAGQLDVWVMNADGSEQQRLTDHPAHDYLPSWTPDGRSITFMSWRAVAPGAKATNHAWIMNADGSDQRLLMGESPGTSAGLAWFPDGQTAVQTRKTSDEGADLYLLSASGEVLRRLTEDARYNGSPDISPDGKRLVFYSEADGRAYLEVIDADGRQRRVILDDGTSWSPRWSPDGCWLAYAAAFDDVGQEIDIMAMPIDGRVDPVTLVGGPGRQAEASWRPGGATTVTCARQP